MAASATDDGSIADLPWASVFDPAANVRALGAIQERGFRAATEVVDRFVRLNARGFGAPNMPTDAEQSANGNANGNGNGNGTAYPDPGRMLTTWQNFIGQLGQTVVGAASAAEPTLDLANSAATGEARLHATGPGLAQTEVWLHNRGPDDMGVLRLRCSDLLSHDGELISSTCVRFEPDEVPIPARSSRGITVEILLTRQNSPGRYRGTLLADGHGDVWMPVVLTIAPPSS